MTKWARRRRIREAVAKRRRGRQTGRHDLAGASGALSACCVRESAHGQSARRSRESRPLDVCAGVAAGVAASLALDDTVDGGQRRASTRHAAPFAATTAATVSAT